MSEGLKLKAFDEESLVILSSLTQDSIIKINELGYDNSAKRFAVLMNRYCHEKEGTKRIDQLFILTILIKSKQN